MTLSEHPPASPTSVRLLAPQEVDDIDALLMYDAADHKQQLKDQVWRNNPNHFMKVKVSALAVLKMAIHARSGGDLEVMGMLQGKVVGDAFIIVDSFIIPVEGTETRVNPHETSFLFMLDFLATSQEGGRLENIVGWYHSHPGYGCWLSGIDVETQRSQQLADPMVAIVIDPHRSAAAGKVDIGAFRTYPTGQTPGSVSAARPPLPPGKMDEFGVHANEYYPLEVSLLKSRADAAMLDAMWNKYWGSTLASNPLLSSMAFGTIQVQNGVTKLDTARIEGRKRGASGETGHPAPLVPLAGVCCDMHAVAMDALKGAIHQTVKQRVFGQELEKTPGGDNHRLHDT